MGEPIVVDLFVEDRAHEEFIRAMVERLAAEERRGVTVRVRSARGGHGRALTELGLYQRGVRVGGMTAPDLLVVAIDANCKRLAQARKEIEAQIDSALKDRTIIACPDPHIERWYLADPESFARVVGVRPTVGRKKCERDRYKAILSRAIVEAGHPPTLGGIEFAREIVESMDAYRGGKTERTLRDFMQDARNAIRRAAPEETA